MNLAQLRQEVLDHGFDLTQYGARIVTYLNDAQMLIARRVDYYIDETTEAIATIAGTDTYPWPAGFARMRSLFDTGRNVELQSVSISDIDSSSPSSGAPMYYATYSGSMQVYPKPDGVYNLELRYWKLPTALASDSDVPNLPADWHHILWVYATWLCYEADDDAQMGQYWEGRFKEELSAFSADQKFPDTDRPRQAAGMWDQQPGLNSGNQWTLYGF